MVETKKRFLSGLVGIYVQHDIGKAILVLAPKQEGEYTVTGRSVNVAAWPVQGTFTRRRNS